MGGDEAGFWIQMQRRVGNVGGGVLHQVRHRGAIELKRPDPGGLSNEMELDSRSPRYRSRLDGI
jgi:hypothetical protein